MSRLARLAPLSLLLMGPIADAHAEPPAQVPHTPTEVAESIRARDTWTLLEEEVPPLRHELGDRWPMIAWHGTGQGVLSTAQIELLLARGLTQHLPFDPAMVPAAQALQAAGSKVILMEGRAGNWPYSLAGDSTKWALPFDEGYGHEMAGSGPLGTWHSAMPLWTEGWSVYADQVRSKLQAFRDAGVTVNGIWMDYEGDPYPFDPFWEQLRNSPAARRLLPPEVLTDRDAWFAWSFRLYSHLHGAYLAAPALEVFPEAAVTNWHIVFSSPEHVVYYFVDNRPIPPVAPGRFTASNPVAYGNDLWFEREWRDDYRLDRRGVDQFYMHNLLRQISADTANRLAFAPHAGSFPWVSRFCPMGSEADAAPDMSRGAYREALRHMWLRGIDGMQLFNARRAEYEAIWLEELQDAVAAYDEILGHAEFFDDGEVMNLDTPAPQHDGIFWSGLRLGDRALVRLTNQGGGQDTIVLHPWEGTSISLSVAADTGVTHVLERHGDEVRVRP